MRAVNSPAAVCFGIAVLLETRELALQPYGVAFVDMRMPPGWDGIETAARIWEQDPRVHIVICTAYSDYSWEEILKRLGHSDRLLILKKPFDNIEVLQIADALTQKWWLARQVDSRLEDLERMVDGCARDPHTVDDALSTTTHEHLVAATQRANAMLLISRVATDSADEASGSCTNKKYDFFQDTRPMRNRGATQQHTCGDRRQRGKSTLLQRLSGRWS